MIIGFTHIGYFVFFFSILYGAYMTRGFVRGHILIYIILYIYEYMQFGTVNSRFDSGEGVGRSVDIGYSYPRWRERRYYNSETHLVNIFFFFNSVLWPRIDCLVAADTAAVKPWSVMKTVRGPQALYDLYIRFYIFLYCACVLMFTTVLISLTRAAH